MAQLGYEAPADLITRKIELLQASSDDAVFVAVLDTAIAGCLSAHAFELFHAEGRFGRITSLVADEDVRGAGVGRALVERALVFFREAGCIRAEVTSGDHRAGAHAFYKSVGFKEDNRRFIQAL
ncbi:N-acetyltransferase [Labrys miyagiensis]|uniref:N-acetyltransferase n=1 Tax=Labrys miyagiensis TaxID=346912 RepID=A0ABQ6CGE9_9HYPH|nr:GNAT family N-acetyltransferase [Labrys miyagiensis]GLS17920.1 N-acetyltransferase [Labrys miyagiensis]